jgi:phage host-nuclease inhibitor protein Gam
MTQLTDIEKRAKAFADARAEVSSIVTVLNDGIDALKRDNMPALKRCIAKVAERHDNLRALIDANPQLFTKPKTVVFHGVKVGFAKGKGGISFDDEAQVVKLIKKHLPDQAEVLIITKEKPARDALAQLSAADLKKIGCTVVNTGDQVVIKPADSEVDKLVDTLIKGATETDSEVEA